MVAVQPGRASRRAAVPSAPGGRHASLDGLRGLAALAVLLHHALLVVPGTAGLLAEGSTPGSPAWWAVNTPLHVVWAGNEAVLLFFVLSGFVLALPATRRPVAWASYYPKRLVRLYLPVWGSLCLAVALAVLVPRDAEPGRSAYLTARAGASPSEAPRNALLLLDGGQLLNSPLWSLRWEVAFSLLLPAYLLLPQLFGARGGRSLGPGALGAGLAAVLAVLAVGSVVGTGALFFLPVFALGVLLAYAQEPLQQWADRVSTLRRARLVWSLLALLAAVLLTAEWTVAGLPLQSRLLEVAATGGPFAGACLAVFVAMHSPTASRALSSAMVQTLGVLSFSLYLVHEPVLVTTAFLLPVEVSPWAAVALAVPLSLAVAVLFHRAVEGPSHRLAQRVGAALTPAGAPSAEPSSAEPSSADPSSADPSSADPSRR
jgi:peptidoglycan/LPS O-acetylase OafA/YrhL